MGFQSDAVYELYWIRENHHKDFKNEGYIGITCKGLERRFSEHCWTAEKGEGWTLHEKIRDIGQDKLVATTLCIGSFSYIKDLELKMRPKPYIGWNHAKGGGGHTPEFARERQKRTAQKMKGTEAEKKRIQRYKKSMEKYWNDPNFMKRRAELLSKSWQSEGAEERRKKASEVAKNNWKDESIRRQMLASMRKTFQTEEYKKKASESKKKLWKDPEFREKQRKGASEAALKRYSENPWWYHPSANYEVAKISGEVHKVWSCERMGHARLEKRFGFKKYAFDHLVRKFRKGWNPWEDEMWMKEFYNV